MKTEPPLRRVVSFVPRFGFALVLAVGVGSIADAQQPQGTVYGQTEPMPEPLDLYGIPGVTDETFGRTVTGDFNGDGVTDVALLADDALIVLSGRYLYLSHETPWTGVIDVDAYAAGGPTGQDVLLFTDAAGLHLGWFDTATKDFTDTLVDGVDWAGALSVRVSDVDGMGRADVLGISAGGDELLVMTATGTAPTVFTPSTAAGFTYPGTLRSFAVLEWNGTGSPELAVLTDNELAIVDLVGTTLQQWSAGSNPGGTLLRLAHDYLSYDRLAWVTNEALNAQGQPIQFLIVVDHQVLDPALGLAPLGVSAAHAADWDGDGDDDVVLAHAFKTQLAIAYNARSAAAPTAVSFPAGGPASFHPIGPIGLSNPGQVASIVFADLDQDGDRDLATAVQSTGEFRRVDNPSFDADSARVALGAMTYDVTSGSPTGVLSVRVGPPAVLPPTATDVQVIQWRQELMGLPTDPAPVSNETFPLSSWPLDVTVEVPESGQYFDSVYYLEVRLVATNQGAITKRFPGTVGGMTMSPLAYQALLATEGAGAIVGVVLEGDLVFQPGESGAGSGGYVPDIKVPASLGIN